MNYTSCARVAKSLEISFFYLERYSSVCKKFQKVHPELFLTSFLGFFDSVYYRLNIYFYWPTLLFESTDMNCAFSARVTESLQISVLIWNNIVLAQKVPKRTPQIRFQSSFQFFFAQSSIGQTIPSIGQTFHPNRLI